MPLRMVLHSTQCAVVNSMSTTGSEQWRQKISVTKEKKRKPPAPTHQQAAHSRNKGNIEQQHVLYGSNTGSWVQSVVASAQKRLKSSLKMIASKYRQPFVLPGEKCCSGAGRAWQILISGFQIAVGALRWIQIVVYSAQKPPVFFYCQHIKLSTKVCAPYCQKQRSEVDPRCQVVYSKQLVCG